MHLLTIMFGVKRRSWRKIETGAMAILIGLSNKRNCEVRRTKGPSLYVSFLLSLIYCNLFVEIPDFRKFQCPNIFFRKFEEKIMQTALLMFALSVVSWLLDNYHCERLKNLPGGGGILVCWSNNHCAFVDLMYFNVLVAVS